VSGCHILVDLILRSSDKVLIGAHKANLETYSDGFPSADSVDDTHEPVDLTERAGTLKQLMHGMHKQKFVSLDTLRDADTAFDLAEAAEKYLVYSVMAACSEKCATTTSPVKAFCYGIKHDYPLIADAAARWTIDVEVKTMRESLNGDKSALLAWVRHFSLSVLQRIH
ncbi:hypothetical protein DFP72DRAFT_823321, partial [Ephemerocybe angulata]